MDPVTALRQIAYYKDRNRHDPRRVMAYRNAADIIEGLDDAARQRHGQANSWQSLAGIGPKTAKVIAQAWSGREPDLLAELRADAEDLGGGAIRAALRGDLHLHSNWSDGSAPIEEMMATAAALGHQYCALTDHSPRLTIANGLSPDRLRKQLDVIDELREKFAPLRILTGIEVDILEDGSLDQEPEMLDRLDIVVASVHSKLSMDSAAMTRRMVRAVANGHTDVLGHCTGRLIAGNRGIRPESKFDAEAVFTACREHGTAVEINSRPERRDPPTRLLHLARDIGYGAGGLGRQARHDAAALTHLHRVAARPGRHRREAQPLAAGDHGLHRGTVEERAAPGGRVQRLPEVATAHAEDVPEPDPAPATRGVRRAKALRPALQPLGPAIVLGAQRRPVPGHSSREGRGGDRHH